MISKIDQLKNENDKIFARLAVITKILGAQGDEINIFSNGNQALFREDYELRMRSNEIDAEIRHIKIKHGDCDYEPLSEI